MKKIGLLYFLLLSPAQVFAADFSEEKLFGDWCLEEVLGTDDMDDEFLELGFAANGVLRYRVNPLSAERRQGTFRLLDKKLMLKTSQGLTLRTFALESMTGSEFIGKHSFRHKFSRGVCK